jgi:hypothetical protein
MSLIAADLFLQFVAPSPCRRNRNDISRLYIPGIERITNSSPDGVIAIWLKDEIGQCVLQSPDRSGGFYKGQINADPRTWWSVE